ncbi:MAG: hypothetical protein ACRC46_00145 [Thermoguttaceae bacterium]
MRYLSKVCVYLLTFALSISFVKAQDDFGNMRGANYVPSYARNDVQIWADFDSGTIDRELGFAAKLKLNAVRVFHQIAVYERDPKTYLENFETFLALCDKHRIRMMPVVFDSCFGEFPDLKNYPRKDWMACPGQDRLGIEHRSAMHQFMDEVIGKHKDDPRIVMWDIMNEPFCTSFNTPADKDAIVTFARHALEYAKSIGTTQPLCVGVMHSDFIHHYADLCDVLAFHNYRNDLREDVRKVKAIGKQLGKPVIINEVVHRDGDVFYEFAMPILAEENIGWVFWELMFGKTQFTRNENSVQGLIYPDGTCRYAGDVVAVLYPDKFKTIPYADYRKLAADAGIPQRNQRWSPEETWTWYKQHKWITGFNFLPSSASNTTEFWAEETFDPVNIDRELKIGSQVGFNACRVFLQYAVWQHDPAGFKKRFERFLEIADSHGISVMPVLFDDCSFGNPPERQPALGPQRDVIPGMIAPAWTPSPGLDSVTDPTAWPSFRCYVTDMVGTFSSDNRVLVWDVYNEPGNSGMGNLSIPLLVQTFLWARDAKPKQPLTSGVWGAPPDVANIQILCSDVVSFHFYGDKDGLFQKILDFKRFGRPVLCTESMARPLGSVWESDYSIFKEEGVANYCWGLVNGRMQCQYAWWNKPDDPEPELWFHDLFHTDGTPYRSEEVEVIQKINQDKKLDFEKRDYRRSEYRPSEQEIVDTDSRIHYDTGWTLWDRGGVPRHGTLHYANQQGSTLTLEFEGTGIVLFHKIGPDCGFAEIEIDERKSNVSPLNTWSSQVDWSRRALIAENLPAGNHMVKIVVTGTASPESTNTYLQVVGFEVLK